MVRESYTPEVRRTQISHYAKKENEKKKNLDLDLGFDGT